MPEAHVIEYEITEEQAAAAAHAVVGSLAAPRPGQMRLRRMVVRSVAYGVLGALGIVLGVAWELPWWVLIGPVLILALVAFVLVSTGLAAHTLRPGHLDASLREAFRRLESPHIRWTITEEALAVEAGRGGAREFGWEDVEDVYLTGTFWLLQMKNGPTMLLLADRIPDATARFLLTRARDVGATIRVAGRPYLQPDGAE